MARGEDESTGVLDCSEELVMTSSTGVQSYESLQHSVKIPPNIILE